MAGFGPIDVQKALKGADCPASRDDLVSLAKRNGAEEHVVQKLSEAGTDRFKGPGEVQKALFGNESTALWLCRLASSADAPTEPSPAVFRLSGRRRRAGSRGLPVRVPS
jgi:hypothetical protein